MNKILFIDLDGTIIETKSGKLFPLSPDDWKFRKDILEKLSEYSIDHTICIITNQGGVNEGHIKPLELENKLKDIVNNIEAYIRLENPPCHLITYRIAGLSTNSKLRKPNPTLALEVMNFMEVDKKDCLMVGDASGSTKEKITSIYFKDQNQNVITKQISELTYAQLNNLNPTDFYVEDPFNIILSKNLYLLKSMETISKSDLEKITVYKIKKSFSDSDLRFAENAGIRYMDIENFLITKKENNVPDN